MVRHPNRFFGTADECADASFSAHVCAAPPQEAVVWRRQRRHRTWRRRQDKTRHRSILCIQTRTFNTPRYAAHSVANTGGERKRATRKARAKEKKGRIRDAYSPRQNSLRDRFYFGDLLIGHAFGQSHPPRTRTATGHAARRATNSVHVVRYTGGKSRTQAGEVEGKNGGGTYVPAGERDRSLSGHSSRFTATRHAIHTSGKKRRTSPW